MQRVFSFYKIIGIKNRVRVISLSLTRIFNCLYQLVCPLNSFCENKTGRLSHKLYLENHKYGKHFKIINPRALTYNPPARKSEQKRMSIKINDFILPYSNNFSTNNITIEFAFIFFSTRKQFSN